jgi:hypothetical protein
MAATILQFPMEFRERTCSGCGAGMARISESPSIDGRYMIRLFGCFRCDEMVREDVPH